MSLYYYYKSTVCFWGLGIMKEMSEITTENIGWMTQKAPWEGKPQIITDPAPSSWKTANLCKTSEYDRIEATLRVWIQNGENTMISVPTQRYLLLFPPSSKNCEYWKLHLKTKHLVETSESWNEMKWTNTQPVNEWMRALNWNDIEKPGFSETKYVIKYKLL